MPMESSRDVQAFRAADWQMMIIPSLQDKMWHVIIDRVGENGVLINRLYSREEIYSAFDIKV
jgi:hypothetical protein